MKVYLAKKNGAVIFHTDLAAMKELDGVSKPEKTVTIGEWEAAGSVAHIGASGAIVLGEPSEVEAARKEAGELAAEEMKLQQELDRTDWVVVRAAERGEVMSEIDVPFHERREWCRNRISEIRARLAELHVEDVAA